MPLFDAHAYYGPSSMFAGLDSVGAVQASMERYGIDALALVSARARHCDFIEGNHQLRTIVDDESGIFGLVTLNPAYPDESIQEQRIYLAKHAFVGAIMFPGQSGNPVLLSEARDILNAQRRFAKPMLIYVEDREGVNAARDIATEFNQMKFILLNMAGHDWRYAVALARSHPNVALDMSGTLDADKYSFAASVVSPRKLMFGSGQPYADPSLFLSMLNDAALISELDRKRITHQNALAWFNIDAEVE